MASYLVACSLLVGNISYYWSLLAEAGPVQAAVVHVRQEHAETFSSEGILQNSHVYIIYYIVGLLHGFIMELFSPVFDTAFSDSSCR